VLQLLERVRDEAHRFAITFQRHRRTKKAFVSALDPISGVGPKRKQALLTQFGDVRAIAAATVEELITIPGITRPVAEKVLESLLPKAKKKNTGH
jgi:excinuclease ABC subunit C